MGYYSLSLKTRIWIVFVLLITLSVGSTGALSYFIASEVMKKNSLELNQSALNKSVEVLDEKLKNITIAILGLAISEPMKQAMRDVQQGKIDSYYSDLSAFQTPLTQAMVQEPLIDSILIVTPIGEFYPLTKRRLSENKFEQSELYRRFKEHQGALWVETHKDQFFSNQSQVMSLVVEGVADFPVEKVYMIVNIQEKALKEAINSNIGNKGGEYFLLDRAGQEVFSSGFRPFSDYNANAGLSGIMASASNGYAEVDVLKDTYLMNHARLSVNSDWTLVSIMSRKELLRDMVGIQILTLCITLGSIVLALLLSKYLTGILLEPLTRLQKLMKKVGQNDFSVRFSSKYQDEVTQVGFRFNSMLEETTGLIEQMKHMEREKLKQEIKSLQAQIDPHFLYNTLNTIYWRSQLNQNEDVQQMILSLSRMFQLGLNGGRETTELEKEMQHVRQYLNLQQKCCVQLFDYTLEMNEPSLLKHPVLKLLLQPLVENSILHGFQNLKSGGRIVIRIGSGQGMLYLQVEDNGCGMKTQDIVRTMQRGDDESKSYALRNVYQRLELYYQGKASIEMDSLPFESTVVTIRIPLQGEYTYV